MSVEAGIVIAQLLLKFGPGVAQAVSELLHKSDPKPEDWNRVFALAAKPFDGYFKTPPLPL